MKEIIAKLVTPKAPGPVLLIRLMVGAVFFSEGIQKFLYPAKVGTGRFARIGIPWPEFTGPFVGVVEIVCGSLVLAGLLTRLAAIPLIANMIVAIVSTKIPILLGHGFWGMAHEIRNDWSMLVGSLFLLVVGPDRFTADARLSHRLERAP